MTDGTDTLRFRLLDEHQRDFPLVERPFAQIADALETTEARVLGTLAALVADGAIARVGATVRPNTAGVSTLAAMALPEGEIDGAAVCLSALRGINHSYLREDAWNLWFVATAPDEPALAGMLDHVARTTGRRVLDLRLVRQFHIDLGFSLSGRATKSVRATSPDISLLQSHDRPLLQALSEGLALVERPYAELGHRLGRSAPEVMRRIGELTAAGIISRLGVIVRHRKLGWAANAMVVWDVPEASVEAIGHKLAHLPGVSLCYQRRAYPDVWPYRLYIMVHARTRSEAQGEIALAAALPELEGVPRKCLFSTHCFKQSGAWLHREEIAA